VGEVLTAADVEGVGVFPLKQFADERGKVMHMLRADAPHFERFGEIYFSVIRPGAIKAWKRHRVVTQNLAVPLGRIRLVVFDSREASRTFGAVQEMDLGEGDYALVRIPPMLWYGFRGMAAGDSLIANCASLPHDPAEAESISPDSGLVPYRWSG
jgi:dTDP-4-dehydrorhamnose 3,5-epimerase